MLIAPLFWLGLRTVVRKNGDPDSPDRRRKRKARKALARELKRSKTASEEARALYDFLGARTREGAPAWVGRDAVDFLTHHAREGGEPLPEPDTRALAELVEKLDASTYAGNDQPIGETQVLAVADRLMKAGM